MKPDLMDILCCPVCRGPLALTTTSSDGTEILTGTIACAKCPATYPIEDGIPDLLPPDERD
ncbi:MAG: methytransferase partner Trm112 [Thermoplasmata archaeon]